MTDPALIPPGQVPAELMIVLRRVIAGSFPPLWADVVGRTPAERISVQSIFDVTAPRYVSGRIALAGDAGATARPHTASGTVKALEDALALESGCRAATEWAPVLAGYDRVRAAAGNALTALGRSLPRAGGEHARLERHVRDRSPGVVARGRIGPDVTLRMNISQPTLTAEPTRDGTSQAPPETSSGAGGRNQKFAPGRRRRMVPVQSDSSCNSQGQKLVAGATSLVRRHRTVALALAHRVGRTARRSLRRKRMAHVCSELEAKLRFADGGEGRDWFGASQTSRRQPRPRGRSR